MGLANTSQKSVKEQKAAARFVTKERQLLAGHSLMTNRFQFTAVINSTVVGGQARCRLALANGEFDSQPPRFFSSVSGTTSGISMRLRPASTAVSGAVSTSVARQRRVSSW